MKRSIACKMKKRIGIYLLLVIVVFFFILGMLYDNGFFKIEKFSGLEVYHVSVTADNTDMQKLPIQDEYNLKLQNHRTLKLDIESGWNYQIKYFDFRSQFSVIEYKKCDYIVLRNGEVFVEDNYDINHGEYHFGTLVDETNYFRSSGYCVDTNAFQFYINETGKYEVIVHLKMYINDKDYSETKKVTIYVSE